MEGRLGGEKVKVKALNEERAERQEDQDNGNHVCDGEQSEDIQCGREEMFNKERDKAHNGKDERIKEEENDSDDDEDDQPPVVPLHPAGLGLTEIISGKSLHSLNLDEFTNQHHHVINHRCIEVLLKTMRYHHCHHGKSRGVVSIITIYEIHNFNNSPPPRHYSYNDPQ